GTHTKSLHAGMAARNAVMAVQLAGAGFTSNPSFLEGAGGLLNVYGRGDSNRLQTSLSGLGKAWLMPETLTSKRFPCCGSTHGTITAIQAILEDHPVSVDAVDWLEIAELPPASHVLLYPHPEDGFQGKFSVEYTAAMALAEGGEVTVDTFAEGGVNAPGYLAARDKVRVKIGSKWQYGGEASFEDTTVTIRLKDGRELQATVDRYAMPGTRHQPLPDCSVKAKFDDNCRRAGFDPSVVYSHWSRIGQVVSMQDSIAVAATASATAHG